MMTNRRLPDSLSYDTRLAEFHAKSGPVKVFGENVDERKQLTSSQAQNLFAERWKSTILPAMREGRECSIETARGRLHEKQLHFLSTSQLLWEFEIAGLDFIAQIDEREDVRMTQLWAVTSIDANPKLLRVVFGTVEERRAFEALAIRLGWKSEDLGLALVRDFAKKLDRLSS
jgi:hypothetical protein